MQDWTTILTDASTSGVHDQRGDIDRAGLREVAGAHGLEFVVIDLAPVTDKEGLLSEMSQALEFPSFFGMNWDALSDSLTDLSWKPAAGYVIVFAGFPLFLERAPAAADMALNVLRDAAGYWRGKGVPFHVVL